MSLANFQWSGSLVLSQQRRPRRLYEGRELNKDIVKQTMRSLEACDLQTAREKYLEYVGSARLDRSGPIEDDEQGQAELASDLSDALDGTTRTSDNIQNIGDGLHAEEQGRMKRSGDVRRTAFHNCRADRQVCVRRQRPIYAELEGKCAGDAISFNGRELLIEKVACQL
jgi:hypothetical protein